MKFTDGFWHTRPGVDAQYAAEAYDISAYQDDDGGRLVILAPTRVITGRGDTLNRALLTVTLSSPLEGVVKVRIEHHRGPRPPPGFNLLGTETGHGTVEAGPDGGTLEAGQLRARITPGAPWNLTFEADGKVLTRSGHKSVGYVS